MRKPIIAGNWKMNNTLDQALKLVQDLKPLVKDGKCDVVICPSFICLKDVIKEAYGTNIKVGAQNMYCEESGAFTGEVSPLMLRGLGVSYVIIGHSERRQYFNETDELINKKVRAALDYNLIPIVCCGETLYERESEITKEVLGRQIKIGLKGFTFDEIKNVVVAYEPVWAIGTGKTATDQEANDSIFYIRTLLEEMYGKEISETIRIQYGGSVKPSTIKAQMAMPHIDGALVGGASLKAEDFAAIINY